MRSDIDEQWWNNMGEYLVRQHGRSMVGDCKACTRACDGRVRN